MFLFRQSAMLYAALLHLAMSSPQTDGRALGIGTESSMSDEIIIAPGELISKRIVHPANERIIQRRAKAVPLPAHIVRRIRSELRTLQRELRRGGYYQAYETWRSASDEWNALLAQRAAIMDDIERATTDDERADARRALRAVSERARLVAGKIVTARKAALPYRASARRERQIVARLHSHEIALDQARAERWAQQRYEQELKDVHDIVQETLTRLGYAHRRTYRGRTVTDRVKIAEMHANADTYFLKIATTRKTWFGWQPLLPEGVHPMDLIDTRTTEALGVALQLQVEGVRTDNNGIWYKIHRMRSKDGLMNTVKWRAAVALLDSPDVDKSAMPVVAGIGAGRVPSILYMDQYPHGLIAGMSGSGKSNQVRNILGTLISRTSPDDLRLVLVDMKEGTEFKIYQDAAIPHLLALSVTPPEFLRVLTQLELMRIERSKRFQSVWASNLREYNERVPQSQRLPRIMVWVDEFGAIYLSDPRSPGKDNKRVAEQIKGYIRQLLAKARSAGIHLWICTQTPYVEILPGPDKANISVMNVFRLPNKSSSMAVMGNGMAAELPQIPGRGWMLTGGNQWQIQAPHMTPEDVQASIDQAMLWPAPRNEVILPEVEDRQARPVFTREKLIDLALAEYDGRISARRMWEDGAKEMISYEGLTALAQTIYAQKELVHNGKVYEVVPSKGGGKRLKLKTEVAGQGAEYIPEYAGMQPASEAL